MHYEGGDATLCLLDSDCPEDQSCGKMISQPADDIMNMDTYAYSMIQVFATSTLEGWTELMIYLQITVNYYVWIYNVTLAFIGAFVVVNLVLAVVAIKFVQIQGESEENEGLEEEPKVWELFRCQDLNIVNKRLFFHNKILSTRRTKTFGEVFGDISAFFSKKAKKLDNLRKSFKMQDIVASIKSKFS